MRGLRLGSIRRPRRLRRLRSRNEAAREIRDRITKLGGQTNWPDRNRRLMVTAKTNATDKTENSFKLERQAHVERLLAVTRLLHVHDLAAAAIGDTRLCDLA